MAVKKKSKYTGIPFYIIWLGKFLQFFSIDYASKYALKLFFTPIRFARPKREQEMFAESKKELLLIPEVGKKVMVYNYGNAKKKILLVHGWSGRGTQMNKIAKELVKLGYMTVSFDAPAHGKSTGKMTHMGEFVETIKLLDKKYSGFDAIIGHSLGGVATLNALKDGVRVNKAIIISSADIITDVIKHFTGQLKLNSKVAKNLKALLDKRFKMNIDDSSAYLAAKEITVPVLIIHDKDDKETLLECAVNIHKHLKKGQLIVTETLGHRRILRDDKVTQKIVSFITS